MWLDEDGVRLRVGPDSDGIGLIQVTAPTEKDKEYFGKVDISVSADVARALGKALITMADANEAE